MSLLQFWISSQAAAATEIVGAGFGIAFGGGVPSGVAGLLGSGFGSSRGSGVPAAVASVTGFGQGVGFASAVPVSVVPFIGRGQAAAFGSGTQSPIAVIVGSQYEVGFRAGTGTAIASIIGHGQTGVSCDSNTDNFALLVGRGFGVGYGRSVPTATANAAGVGHAVVFDAAAGVATIAIYGDATLPMHCYIQNISSYLIYGCGQSSVFARSVPTPIAVAAGLGHTITFDAGPAAGSYGIRGSMFVAAFSRSVEGTVVSGTCSQELAVYFNGPKVVEVLMPGAKEIEKLSVGSRELVRFC